MNEIFYTALILWVVLVILCKLYTYYNPTLDYILDNNYYTVYLWYYKYDKENNSIKRTYKVLFKIRR